MVVGWMCPFLPSFLRKLAKGHVCGANRFLLVFVMFVDELLQPGSLDIVTRESLLLQV